MYRFVIDDTNQNHEVYVDLISSSAGRYLSRRPYILGLIKELMSEQKLKGARIVIEHDMGRKIGTTDLVSTSGEDGIYYARPLKTEAFFRFAKNRYPEQSNTLTVIMDQDADGNYEISDTWIGPYYPAFPGDKNETADSKVYWQTHALAHDSKLVQSKSITKDCPY